MRQISDIDTTRCDIGRDQHANLIGLEHAQCTLTSRLTLVAMNRHCADALLIQMGSEFVRTMLGASKDEHLRPIALLDYFSEKLWLRLLRDDIRLLVHTVCGGITRSHFDLDRIVQHGVGQFLHIFGVSRREEQVLTL